MRCCHNKKESSAPAFLGRCIRKGQARRASSRLAYGQMFLRAAHLPFGALHQNGTDTPRIVTVGLRPNVPQSGAPAFLGRCIRKGQARRVSSRLACGQMFLRAAHLPFWGAASEWDRHAAHRHGWPAAKCSSEQRTCPFGALHKNGAGTPRFVTVGLWPNVPQSSAPVPWKTQIYTGKWEGTHHGIGCRHSFAGSGRA